MATTTSDLVGAIARKPHLPIVFESSEGDRYELDPESAPYTYDGCLVVPIVHKDEV